MIKKTIKNFEKDLPPAKLYLEDLQEIEEKLKNISDELSFDFGEFTVESINDLNNSQLIGNIYRRLRIAAIIRKPHYEIIRINFYEFKIDIIAPGELPEAKGIASDICEIIERKKSLFPIRFFNIVQKHSKIRFKIVYIVLMILGFISILISRYTVIEKALIVIGTLLFLFSIIFVGIVYHISLEKYSKIIISNKKEERTFWQKNKDRIITAFITALITAILSLIVGIMIKNC